MTQPTHLVSCIGNEGAEDLQVLRVYRRLPDEAAEAKGFLRVIDDSGEGEGDGPGRSHSQSDNIRLDGPAR